MKNKLALLATMATLSLPAHAYLLETTVTGYSCDPCTPDTPIPPKKYDMHAKFVTDISETGINKIVSGEFHSWWLDLNYGYGGEGVTYAWDTYQWDDFRTVWCIGRLVFGEGANGYDTGLVTSYRTRVVPEPATWGLFAAGLFGLVALRRGARA